MINSKFFLGKPENFKGLCKIYPPSVNDVLDDEYYPFYRKFLTLSGEELEDEYAESKIPFDQLPTPLEYLFQVIDSDERLKEMIANGFKFFIHEEVTFLSDLKVIVIGNLVDTLTSIKSVEELRMLNSENYFDFQNLLRQSIGEKEVAAYDPYEHPKVKYFKAKQRLRDKVKAESQESLTFGSTLAVICCMDLGINPLNVGELSQCAISVLIRYYQEKTKYKIDIKSLLAGADSKKIKPKNWIRNVEDL